MVQELSFYALHCGAQRRLVELRLLLPAALSCPEPVNKHVFKNGRFALKAGGAEGEQPLARCREAARAVLKSATIVQGRLHELQAARETRYKNGME